MQLQLTLQQLLALLFEHQLSIVLVLEKLLVQDANEGVLIVGDVLADLILSVAKLLHNSLHDLVIKADHFAVPVRAARACVVVI